jgi:cobalt ECF transporter T component CbiQ
VTVSAVATDTAVGTDTDTDTATAAPPQLVTPDWLLSAEVGLCPCGCIGRRRKGGFVEKTLTGSATVLKQVMFSEDVAGHRGLFQRLDPRTKILGLVGLLVVASVLRNIPALAALYLVTLCLAAWSALPVAFFVKRVWLFVPLFTGIVVLPATLSVITPGEMVLTLWHWHSDAVGLTRQGLTAAGLIVMRVAASISLVVLVTVTTPWWKLLAALRTLGVPRIFVLVIGMSYRYLFLLLATMTEMYQARKARTAGPQRHDRGARVFLGASAGALLGKANQLSEEVHQAMTARGYRGSPRTLVAFRFGRADAAFAAGGVIAAGALLWGDVLLGR